MKANESFTVTRLKREECNRTKHDVNFSSWQILIGPSDWEDYALGKEGVARYRIHNLPKSAGPGLYELGVAVSRTGLGRVVAKLDPSRIVVVYLGQANNVRTRLQDYGQSGAHLVKKQPYRDLDISKIDLLPNGSGLFDDIFVRGYPIVFRWAPMQSKSDAMKTEIQFLEKFDYAWNKEYNGARRPYDILRKLDKVASSAILFPGIARLLQKRLGVIINRSWPPLIEDEGNFFHNDKNNFFSGVIKFSKSRPRVVSEQPDANQGLIEVDVLPTCGVISTNGTPCRQPPVPGRKRCEEHKGQRIRSIFKAAREGKPANAAAEGKPIYVHEYMDPSTGNCLEHGNTCGVDLGNGNLCCTPPVARRKRCKEHKGMRVNSLVRSGCK